MTRRRPCPTAGGFAWTSVDGSRICVAARASDAPRRPTAHATLDRVDRRAGRGQAGPAARHPRAAVGPARADPRPVGALPARLPRGHRRVRRLAGVDRHPVDHRQHLERAAAVRVRRADPAFRPPDAARLRRADHGRRDRAPGVAAVVPAVRRREHRLAHRRLAAAPRRQRAARRAVPGDRIGSAIAVHVAGGNVGTVVVGSRRRSTIGLIGWRGAVLGLGIAALVVAIAILRRPRGAPSRGRSHGRRGPGPPPYRRVLADRDLRWLFTAAVLGGGSRGLGVLNIFVPALPRPGRSGSTPRPSASCTAILLAASVPGPLVAGWLSDRVGRKPVIIGVYLGGRRVDRAVRPRRQRHRLAVGRDRRAQPVLVRREPAAPGAARRRHAPAPARRRVQHVLRAGVRRGVDVGDPVRALIDLAGRGPRAAGWRPCSG